MHRARGVPRSSTHRLARAPSAHREPRDCGASWCAPASTHAWRAGNASPHRWWASRTAWRRRRAWRASIRPLQWSDLSEQTGFPMSTNTYIPRRALTWVVMAGVAGLIASVPRAHSANLESELKYVESKVIAWRRDIHQHPELS